VEGEAKDLLEGDIRFFLAEDLTYDLVWLFVLVVFLWELIDVKISLDVVRCRRNRHHGDEVNGGQSEPALGHEPKAASHEVEYGRVRPQEWVIEHLEQARLPIVRTGLKVLQLCFLHEYELQVEHDRSIPNERLIHLAWVDHILDVVLICILLRLSLEKLNLTLVHLCTIISFLFINYKDSCEMIVDQNSVTIKPGSLEVSFRRTKGGGAKAPEKSEIERYREALAKMEQ
jgi:hypothetical protein